MPQETMVRGTAFTQPSEREVRAVRRFDAPARLIWDVHTKCEHAREWLLGPEGWEMTECTIDLRPGGSYRYAWRGPEGDGFFMSGEYSEVVEHERLVNTEMFNGEPPAAVDTMTLTEEGGRTTLTVNVEYPSREARDEALATGMEDGWAESYERLDRYIERIR